MFSSTISSTRPTPGSATWRAGITVVVGILTLLLSFNRAMAADDEGNGEITGSDTAAKSKQPYSLQASDPDQPVDPAVVAAKKAAAADAAAKKAKGGDVDEGPPVYQKWQFWAVAGVVVVALVGGIIGGIYLSKAANGGDVAQCPKDFAGCYGQGR